MRKLAVLTMILLSVASCCTPHTEPRVSATLKSCYDLLPEGEIDSMVDFLRKEGLVDFHCGEMVEKHTDYADFYTLKDDDTTGGQMQVVVGYKPSTRRVYDLSYYWQLTNAETDVQDLFGTMESELLSRYGLPSSQRVQNDDGLGTHSLTTSWHPSATQGYRVCLELSYDYDGNPPLLMLEVTNPANE